MDGYKKMMVKSIVSIKLQAFFKDVIPSFDQYLFLYHLIIINIIREILYLVSISDGFKIINKKKIIKMNNIFINTIEYLTSFKYFCI
jgi:hypothetical protein